MEKEIFIFDTQNRKRKSFKGFGNEFRWDGIDEDGKPSALGSYIYLIRIDGKDYKTGVVTLVR
jgi:hypothetical protein